MADNTEKTEKTLPPIPNLGDNKPTFSGKRIKRGLYKSGKGVFDKCGC